MTSQPTATKRLLAMSIILGIAWMMANGDEPKRAAPAPGPNQNTHGSSFADGVSDRFATALKNQNLPMVKAEHLAALRKELHDYLTERVKPTLMAPPSTEVLQALDKFVEREFVGTDSYLRFRGSFDMLKWQLWTATARRPLTVDEASVRDRQRQWMRDYIRKLPATGRTAWQFGHEGRLKVVETEVFANPLSPFFAEPMAAEEFAKFKAILLKRQEPLQNERLTFVASHIFSAAVQARVAALQERWPPGFPVGSLSVGNTEEFAFRSMIFPGDKYCVLSDRPDTQRDFFDVAQNITVAQPPPFDEKATERWLSEKKQGDIRFDAKHKRLVAVRGAKLATLSETEWYEVDRLPLAKLRKDLARSAGSSYSLVTLPAPDGDVDPSAAASALRTLPTLVLETREGKVVLLRIKHYSADSVDVQVRPRPLPPYPPFHLGDVEYRQNR